MKRPALVLLCSALWAALAGPASGQSYRTFQEEWARVQKARIRLGPFYIFPLLSLLNLGYDDNVYFESKGRGDYTANIVAEAKAYCPLGRWILLSARDAPEYSFYLHEKNRREFANSYSYGAKALLFGRFVLSGNYQYEKHRGPLSSEIGSLVTGETKGFDAGLAFETARKTSLNLTVFQRAIAVENFRLEDVSAPLSSAFNRREKGLTLEFNYPLFYEGFLFVSAGYVEYAFAAAGSAWRDSKAVSVSGGLRFPLTGHLSGTLALGYKKFTLKTGPFPSFSGLIVRTELDGRFGRFGIRLLYRRDNPFSFYQDVVYFIENDYGGGISLYLTAFLSLAYNYEYGLGDYPEFLIRNPETGEEVAVRRRDRHRSNSVGLVFRIFTSIDFGLSWNEIRWTSSLPGWDRRRRVISAYLSQRF